MTAWNKHAVIIVTLLAFLAPMACHGGGGGGLLINFPILCSGGWVRPITVTILPLVGPVMICPKGSSSPPPAPSPSPNAPAAPPPPPPPPPPSGAELYPDYYNSSYSGYSCPNAEVIVRKVVEAEIAYQGRGIGAGLVRLHFHDCFVDGCDGSVLLNTTASRNDDTEREGLPNKDSLRGFDVIDKAKAALEDACPSKVSCADIVAFAARDAARSLSSGYIEYKALGGRYDGRESFANHTSTLPGPFSNLDDLIAGFDLQGLSAADLVVLSGAHSIGKARCMFISNRPGMNQTLVEANNPECKNSSSRVNQDNKTPVDLDSKYYLNVDDGNALFDSDAALKDSTDTNDLVEKYKQNLYNRWERDFGEAMVKMGNIKIKTKDDKDAEIRTKYCWTYNH